MGIHEDFFTDELNGRAALAAPEPPPHGDDRLMVKCDSCRVSAPVADDAEVQRWERQHQVATGHMSFKVGPFVAAPEPQDVERLWIDYGDPLSDDSDRAEARAAVERAIRADERRRLAQPEGGSDAE